MKRFRRLLIQALLLPVLPCLGKGPDPEDFNKPTEVEKAQTEVAARMFNLYLEGKPVSDAYLEDISRDPSITADAVKGEAAVDMAVSTPAMVDPTRGVNPTGMAKLAGRRAKVMGDIDQDAVSQKAAGMKTYVENAMGIQSTANTAQAGMAEDAVRRNIDKSQAEYNSDAAGASSMASLAGTGAGMAWSLNKKQA